MKTDDHTKEMLILVFIFIFGCLMLALFPMREELARWIENGAIVAILARAFGSTGVQDKDLNAKSTTVSTTVEQTKKETP